MDDLTYEIFAYSTDFYQLILQLINFTFFKKVSKIYMILVELVKLFSNQSGLIFGRIYSTKVQIITCRREIDFYIFIFCWIGLCVWLKFRIMI